MLWVADPSGRALHLSCGAALFNLRLAIRMLGARPLVWPLPDPLGEPTLLASVQLEQDRPAASEERELYEAIHQRHSSRAPFSEHPIPEAMQIRLEQEAGFEFALLRMLDVRDAALVLRLAAEADQALAADFDHRVELGRWIATEGDDGVPASALGYRPVGETAPVRDFGYASPAIVRQLRDAATASGAVHRARRARRLAAGRAGPAARAAHSGQARARDLAALPAHRVAGHGAAR
jgi:hypothetical protein